jgi:hypothetical protein
MNSQVECHPSKLRDRGCHHATPMHARRLSRRCVVVAMRYDVIKGGCHRSTTAAEWIYVTTVVVVPLCVMSPKVGQSVGLEHLEHCRDFDLHSSHLISSSQSTPSFNPPIDLLPLCSTTMGKGTPTPSLAATNLPPRLTVPPLPPRIHRRLNLSLTPDGVVLRPIGVVAPADEVLVRWGARGRVELFRQQSAPSGLPQASQAPVQATQPTQRDEVELGGVLGIVRLWDSMYAA